MIRYVPLVLSLLVLVWVLRLDPEPPSGNDSTPGLRLGELLGENADGFTRVTAPRPFEFPLDHGPHPDYRTEWWYFTGHLRASDEAMFGFQLTFFRHALRAEPRADDSSWRPRDVYMGHLAVSDIGSRRFYSYERLSRGAFELSGARHEPFKVWLDEWSAASRGEQFLPLLLRASEGDVVLELELSAGKPKVLQGDSGYSAKSDEPGNASYYYSFTRLPARGFIELDGNRFEVTGSAWLDREWSTSALGPAQVGWDWFAVQLDDGRELMFYQLRRDDGSVDANSSGVIVDRAGDVERLSHDQVTTTPIEFWTDSTDGARYPVAWRLQVPSLSMQLDIDAYFPAQAHDLSVRYWEGAARVTGSEAGRALSGNAYVEMTGYTP